MNHRCLSTSSHPLLRAAVSLATVVVITPAVAGEPFTAVFARTCMQYFYKQDELRNLMALESERLPAERSGFFLAGKPGIAWPLTIDSLSYVVSLRDDGICAVFAKSADTENVIKQFELLVAKAPPGPLNAQKLNPPLGPNRGDVASVSYAWSRAPDEPAMLFTLTIAPKGGFPVQAMASLALSPLPR